MLSMVFPGTVDAERITTSWIWERCEHWNEQPGQVKGRGRGLGKREAPLEILGRPSPAKIQSGTLTGAAKGRTDTWNSNSTRSVFTLSSKWDIWPGIVRIVGTRDGLWNQS